MKNSLKIVNPDCWGKKLEVVSYKLEVTSCGLGVIRGNESKLLP
jgi:hypothetical protein